MLRMVNPAPGPQRPSFFQNRFTLAVAAGIALLLLVGAARQFDAQPMHTYTNTPGGFRLRYPGNFILHENEVSVAGSDAFHPVENIVELDAPGHPRPYILIEYMYNMQGQQLDDFIDNSSECDEITQQPGENVLVAGMHGRVYRDISCNSNGETRIYLLNGDIGYNILLHGKPVDERLLALILTNFAPLSAQH